MKMRHRMLVWTAALAALALAIGCGPAVGVRATIRLDERTLVERRALGQRQELSPRQALLPLMPPAGAALTEGEMEELCRSYREQETRLLAISPMTPSVRAWQVIALHNRAVLRARMDRLEAASALLAQAVSVARAYGLGTLEWQALATRGMLTGSDADMEEAARALLRAPLLGRLDYELEDPERRRRLYAALISRALEQGRGEEALGYALEWEAVELARATPPGALAFPPGRLRELADELEEARAKAARLREALCALPPETARRDEAAADFRSALERLSDARAELVAASPAGGLLVPDVADPAQLQELVPADGALLVFAPAGRSAFAAFLLGPEFLARRVALDGSLAARATVGRVLAGRAGPRDLERVSEALLGPFAGALGAEVKRLYLACPPELGGLAWQSLPWQGRPLGERFQLAFLGGAADLKWAWERKKFGRRSLMIAAGWPSGGGAVETSFAGKEAVRVFDVRAGKSGLGEAAAFADMLWFANPLELRPGVPAESYLSFPGQLPLVDGVSVGEVCGLRASAGCVCFSEAGTSAFDPAAWAALRVVTRAWMAAGAPSVVYGLSSPQVPDHARYAYWLEFLRASREHAAARAHQVAAGVLGGRRREAFRLYGFLGMEPEEYAELSTLEFNDRLKQATDAQAAGRLQQAAGAYLELRRMAEARDFGAPERKAMVLANIEQRLATCLAGLRRYQLAAEHQEQVIEQLKGAGAAASAVMAAQYQSLGALLTKAERFEEAADAYHRSLELLGGEDNEQQAAAVLAELGKSLDRAAEYRAALEMFRRSLDAYARLRQPAAAARQERNMGAILLNRLNDPPRAEGHFRRAAELYGAAGRASDALEARIDFGLCRRAVGDLDGALDIFQQCLRAARDEGMDRLTARALSEVANTKWLQGRYQEALALVGRSNDIAARLDDAFRLNVNYQLLGLIEWQLNRYDRAYRALDRAAEEARRAERPLEVASALNNKGIVLRREGKHEGALAAFRSALAIDRKLRSRWGMAYDHRNIGITLRLMKRYDEASAELERAVALAQQIGDRVNGAKALLALGDLRAEQGRPQEAAELLNRALAEARRVALPEVEWRALQSLGRLLRGRDDGAALKDFEAAIDVVEAMRGGLKVEELRSGFLTDKMDLYEDTVALLLDMGRLRDALSCAERSRARKFMDILSDRHLELRSERERELYARKQELARQIRALRGAVAREADEARRKELSVRLERLQRDFSDVLVDIRIANPELSSFVTVQVADPDELAPLLPNDLSLAVYYVMPDSVAVWTLRAGELSVRRIPEDRGELTALVRDYRLAIQRRAALDEVQRRSEELYRLLIAPIEDVLDGAQAVCIVPHGPLHYLSFASLYDGRAYLVERCAVFYVPSISVLKRTLSRPVPPLTEELEVLAVGNPAVGDPAYELPFTEREVASIAQDFVNVTELTGDRAREDWLKQNVGRFDVIHIGAHGRFAPLNPLFSCLMLVGGRDDGLLHLYEVTGLRLKARLVTLSACQSGLGRLRSGDELVSLSRAFEYAGTRAVLSTLWRVDDVSTALVMKHFYRHYVSHGAAVSLRHAQLRVMQDGRHAHPVYWAGVVLTGDYR